VFDEPSPSPIARIPELRWLKNIIVERALTRGDYLPLRRCAQRNYIPTSSSCSPIRHVLRSKIARLFGPVISDINPNVSAGPSWGRDHRHGGLADEPAYR